MLNAPVENVAVLLRASRSRSRLRRPRLREIVPDGGLHDRLERLFIELLVLRDIDRPRLAQELRVEGLLRVRKAVARAEREPHALLEDDPDTHHGVVRPDGRAQRVAGPLPLHILRNLGVRVVDDLAELRQHRAAPIGRLRNQLIDRSRSCHVGATLLRLSRTARRCRTRWPRRRSSRSVLRPKSSDRRKPKPVRRPREPLVRKTDKVPRAPRGLPLKRVRKNRWAERESNPHSQRRLIYR